MKSFILIANLLFSLTVFAQTKPAGTGEIGSGGVSIQSHPPFAANFGFDCQSLDSDTKFFVGAAGPDSSNFPSDMTTPRELYISKGDSANSTSEVKCSFSPTEGICQGPYLTLRMDLTQFEPKITLLGALGGYDNQVYAQGIAKIKVEGFFQDKITTEHFKCDLIQ